MFKKLILLSLLIASYSDVSASIILEDENTKSKFKTTVTLTSSDWILPRDVQGIIMSFADYNLLATDRDRFLLATGYEASALMLRGVGELRKKRPTICPYVTLKCSSFTAITLPRVYFFSLAYAGVSLPEQLLTYLNRTQMRSIDLSDQTLTKTMAIKLGQLEAEYVIKLRELKLTNAGITNETLLKLCPLLSNSVGLRINLSNNNITIDGFLSIAPSINSSSKLTLILENNGLPLHNHKDFSDYGDFNDSKTHILGQSIQRSDNLTLILANNRHFSSHILQILLPYITKSRNLNLDLSYTWLRDLALDDDLEKIGPEYDVTSENLTLNLSNNFLSGADYEYLRPLIENTNVKVYLKNQQR
jgi:hypothetical protein